MFKSFIVTALLALVFFSCKPLIAMYDANAYAQAISIKVDLQNLVDTSSKVEYANAAPLINQVNIEIQKAEEYERGRESNTISTQEYDMLFSEGHSYKAFLKLWESQKTLSPAAADEFKGTIGNIMDRIIKLENGKNK